MSYSIESKCNTCKKQPECSDENVIYGATCAIHSMGQEKGHKGSGVIRLDCGNFENKD